MRSAATALAAAFVAFAVANPAGAQALGIGTAPQGSIGYNMGSAIAQVIAETEKIQARVQPHSGSSAILLLVNSGELDLGLDLEFPGFSGHVPLTAVPLSRTHRG